MIDPMDYLVRIFWSEEDAGFIAVVDDLPGCSAFGETVPEALEEVADAIGAWLVACAEAGNPIPEPTPLPN